MRELLAESVMDPIPSDKSEKKEGPAGLNVLLLEDSDLDAELELKMLESNGYACSTVHAKTRQEFSDALELQGLDIILADYNLPGFDGLAALAIAQRRRPELPFILVSGVVGEEFAVESLKAGATDYVLKSRLERLGPVVGRALRERGQRERARAAEQGLRDAHARLQALSTRTLNVQEEERRRIARELHDEIGQALTAVKIHVQAAQRHLAGPAREILNESINVVDQALDQVRSLSLDLRPPQLDQLGLIAALRWHVDKQAAASGIAAEFSAPVLPRRLSSDLETVAFRIVQEAVTNTIRHSGATRVRVELKVDESKFTLSVADNGRGYDIDEARRRSLETGHAGLFGMQERAMLAGGAVEFDSAPGRGATIRAAFPLHFRTMETS
jgi:signal transduction histidine kinase